MQVCAFSSWRAARIHDNDSHALAIKPALDALPEHGMALGHVRADDEKTFREIEILVASRRAIGTECQFVRARSTGHAKPRIGVDVVGANCTLCEFVENVLRFRCQLARDVKTDCVRAMR